MTNFILQSKHQQNDYKITYRCVLRGELIYTQCDHIFNGESKYVFTGIMLKENNRGWTITTHALNNRPVEIFLSRTDFEKVESLNL